MRQVAPNTFEIEPGETIAGGPWLVLAEGTSWGPFTGEELTEVASVARRPMRVARDR